MSVVAGIGLIIVGVALAVLILRRSFVAAAAGVGLATEALAWMAATSGASEAAMVVLAVGVGLVIGLVGAGIGVHRRRGSDHVDELRELQG